MPTGVLPKAKRRPSSGGVSFSVAWIEPELAREDVEESDLAACPVIERRDDLLPREPVSFLLPTAEEDLARVGYRPGDRQRARKGSAYLFLFRSEAGAELAHGKSPFIRLQFLPLRCASILAVAIRMITFCVAKIMGSAGEAGKEAGAGCRKAAR